MGEIILGVDPGTNITGYALLSSTKTPIDFGCIRPPKNLPLAERYLCIFQAITALITQHTPNVIAVEGQFFYKNAQSALKLGMAKAAVLLAGAQQNIPIHEYNPKVVKKAVVGTGNATKKQMQYMMQRLLSLPTLPEPEDAADALALALCHIHRLPS